MHLCLDVCLPIIPFCLKRSIAVHKLFSNRCIKEYVIQRNTAILPPAILPPILHHLAPLQYCHTKGNHINKLFFCLSVALTVAGVRDFFDVVVGNEDYSHHKPSPDAFLTAAYQLGVDPEDCWGFEDA